MNCRLVIGFLAACVTVLAQKPANVYVGSKACFGCHSSIYNLFRQTDMGRSMSLAADWKPALSSTSATVAVAGSSRTFSVSKGESGWRQSESEPGAFSVDHQLDYVVGSGFNGWTFLIRRGNYLFQAPLSYYSRTEKWDLSPGYEQVDLGFGRMVPQECINCHAGRAALVADTPGAYAEPPFQELAIGCENCHGPGQAHVRSLGKSPGSIVNPAKLKPQLADNICINCHQAGDARVTQPNRTYLDFRPGEWLFDTAVIFKKAVAEKESQSDLLEHYSAMQASMCFRSSGGKVSCLTCHDPHIQPQKEESATYYRAKCLTCHTSQSCKLSIVARNATSPKDNCIGCHMPRRDVLQISHTALTNHRIPARPDEPAVPFKQDEKDGVIVVNPPGHSAEISRVTLLQAYQQLSTKYPDYRSRYVGLLDELAASQSKDAFVQAAMGDRAFAEQKNSEAVDHLKIAVSSGNPAIYLELGQSLAALGRTDEAIEYLKKGVERDPYNSVMQKTLILQYINLKSYGQARLLMQQYVEAFPEDTFMRNLLARVK